MVHIYIFVLFAHILKILQYQPLLDYAEDYLNLLDGFYNNLSNVLLILQVQIHNLFYLYNLCQYILCH